jgi:hypothetical protein
MAVVESRKMHRHKKRAAEDDAENEQEDEGSNTIAEK